MTTTQRKPPARKAPTRSGGQRKPAARKPATRQTVSDGPPSLTAEHVKGFLAGAIAGVLMGAGGMVYLTKESAKGPVATVEPVTSQSEAAPKPRFDFYTVLPNQNLDLGADIEPAAVSSKQTSTDLYVLQAGSFRMQKDADQRRGELALLGLEAQIERTTGDNGVWFRVYVGPFENRSAMAHARSITAQQSIDTLLLKRPRNP